MAFDKLVFPDPDSPIKPKVSPLYNFKLIFSKLESLYFLQISFLMYYRILINY